MASKRIEVKVELERWNTAGTAFWDETVIVEGEVDLEAETAKVTATHPSPLFVYGDRDVEEMQHALYAAAVQQARAEKRSADLATEVRQLAIDLARFAAVNDCGPEADLGLAAAVQEAAAS